MGRDCTLLILDHDREARHVLECTRRPALFDAIAALPSVPLPPHVYGWDVAAEQYGLLTRDPYDAPLRMVTVSQLLPFRSHPDVLGRDRTNHAIWSFLSALPPDTSVILFWH